MNIQGHRSEQMSGLELQAKCDSHTVINLQWLTKAQPLVEQNVTAKGTVEALSSYKAKCSAAKASLYIHWHPKIHMPKKCMFFLKTIYK